MHGAVVIMRDAVAMTTTGIHPIALMTNGSKAAISAIRKMVTGFHDA